ncbi:MAG: NifU-like protein [Acidobacteriota bacterium]|jgi:NifU-like protein|nr:NifU-like protein [Acidobacteriota bacterium]
MPYYPARVNEHFLNPRNAGEVNQPDAVGEAGSLVCGAVVRLSLAIDEGLQRVTQARFRATGCGFLIASASVLTETITDLAISRAASLPETAFTDWFDGLPEDRAHCAALCRDALHAALANYHRATLNEWTGDEALICTCFGVSENSIERAIHTGSLRSVDGVTNTNGAGGGCGSCRPLIEDILEDYWRTAAIQPDSGAR